MTPASGDGEGVVHVAVRGDRVVEPDEALSVGLSDPSNATLGDASAPLTIEDDEPLALAVTSPSVTEGNSGTTPATFTVALDGAAPAGSSVSVDYHVAGVTATVPGDVAPASGTLTFAAGEVPVACSAGARGGCHGTLTLTSSDPVAFAGATTPVDLGSAAFDIAPGATAPVAIEVPGDEGMFPILQAAGGPLPVRMGAEQARAAARRARPAVRRSARVGAR